MNLGHSGRGSVPSRFDRPRELAGKRVLGARVFYGDGSIVTVRDLSKWSVIPDKNVQVVVAYAEEKVDGIPLRKILCGFDYYWAWGAGNDIPKEVRGVRRILMGAWMFPKERFERLRSMALDSYFLDE